MSFVLLLTGCYSSTTVTKDTPHPPLTVEVSFRLNDGTHILSNEYQRVANGYKVVGKLVDKENKNSKHFEGIVSDEQIEEVVIVKYDRGKTVSAIALTVVLVVGGMAIIIWASGGLHLLD